VTQAPIPANETQRLAALYCYNILDTDPEEAFDDLTKLAAYICGTPIALVSLVDTHRLWFKSRQGIDARGMQRDIAFCAHTILQPSDLLVVPDLQQDARFADNPLVASEPHIRFYAGVPLATAEGYGLGTLCVLDLVPRRLSVEQLDALRALGRQVIAQLELRQSIQELKRQHHERLQQEAILRELSTPLIPLSDEVLVMPLIGALDDRRAGQIIATLLQGVAQAQAQTAIVDITGVPVVDTHVANVLIQAAQAVQLLGAQVVLTGIRPSVAQTLVGLGIDLGGIVTRSTLQDGIAYSLQTKGRGRKQPSA
jgi:anti-anti-sigma regulatory factor